MLRSGPTRSRRSARSGPARGCPGGDHDGRLYCGVAAFYRNGYRTRLVQEWLPALEGVVARLEAGARVADIGCGHGHSSTIMAEAFPASRFVGVDSHAASVETAREIARKAGVAGQIKFVVGDARDLETEGFDLVCFFDCLHDLGHPVAAARAAQAALAPRRHDDAGRALCLGPGGGEPEPDRTDLLWELDDALPFPLLRLGAGIGEIRSAFRRRWMIALVGRPSESSSQWAQGAS